MPARLRTTLLTLACTFVATLAPAALASACTDVDAKPGVDPRAVIESATVCLINVERSANGLGPVSYDATLSNVATGHAQDMLARHYFAHVSPDGGTLTDRLRAGHWIPENAAWTAGENIAWGESYLGTPREIVKAWMNSPGHRANILEGDFVDIGIAALPGSPNGSSDAGTYVTNFGWREAAPSGSDATAEEPAASASTAKKRTTHKASRCVRAAKKARTSRLRARAMRRCGRAARKAAARARH